MLFGVTLSGCVVQDVSEAVMARLDLHYLNLDSEKTSV